MIGLSVTVRAGHLELDKTLVRRTLRAAGAEIAALARSKIRAPDGGGRLYYGKRYPGGRHRASLPGQPPATATGNLLRSISVKVFRDGEGVAIRDSAPEALWLEGGARGGGRLKRAGSFVRGGAGIGKTRVLAPRPFLSTALMEREASIGRRLKTSIDDGMKFVREKAPKTRGAR